MGVDDPPLQLDDALVALQVQPDVEVLAFDDALRMVEVGLAVEAEAPEQIVFQRHVELGLARIALPPGASPQLMVDPPAFVPVGADDEQATERDDAVAFERGDRRRAGCRSRVPPCWSRS